MSRGAGWANDPIRAAGGRRHYNALRQERARARRADVIHYLLETGTSLMPGVQRALAQRFHVSEATMSRYIRAIFATPTSKSHRRCPMCGSLALDPEALEAIATGTGT